MKFNIYPILGIHLGFEFTETLVDRELVEHLLVDVFVVRLQFSWYAS